MPAAPIIRGGLVMCKYKVDSPADAHVALFDKYTDDDVHNLMAYLQTLR